MTLILLLAACGLFDDGVIDETCEDLPGGCDGPAGDDGGIDTSPPVAIDVDGVDPEYGLAAGGDSVVITGGPFDASAVVSFGDRDATLLTWQPDSLRVTTPAGDLGWADVTVVTDDGEGSLAEGYRYFADGDGKTGLYGILRYAENVGSLASLGDAASARLTFIEPETGASWWKTWTDGIGRCRSDYAPSLDWTHRIPGADTLTLQSDDGAFLNLAWDSALEAYNGVDGSGVVDPGTLAPGSAWSVESFEGSEFPAFALADLAALPDRFTLQEPARLLETATATITAEELAFRWSGAGAGDAVILSLRLVDPGSGAEVEEVTCAVEDTGSYTVDPGTFEAWEPGLTLYVTIGRALETVDVLPLDGSDTRIVGATVVVAAATTE